MYLRFDENGSADKSAIAEESAPMIGTTVRGAGSAVRHTDPTWRTPEGRGCTSVGMRQEHTVLEVSQRLLASAGGVSPPVVF